MATQAQRAIGAGRSHPPARATSNHIVLNLKRTGRKRHGHVRQQHVGEDDRPVVAGGSPLGDGDLLRVALDQRVALAAQPIQNVVDARHPVSESGRCEVEEVAGLRSCTAPPIPQVVLKGTPRHR